MVFDFFPIYPHAPYFMGTTKANIWDPLGKNYPGFMSADYAAASRKGPISQGYRKVLGYFATLPHFLELLEAILGHGIAEPGKLLADQKPT
jgi:hypothetical protein